MQDISILIKPVSSACNMACTYCFYRDVAAHREHEFAGNLTVSKVEQIVKAAMACTDRSCTFAFQGGEPTLAGLDWFRQIVEIQKKYAKSGVRILNSVQTNGYNIDSEWARFFAENHFLIGISLDGPSDIHNLNRKDHAQKNTYNRVKQTIDLLQRHQVDYNVLSVVTEQSARSIEKIYRHFRKLGIDYMQFIPCLDPIEEADACRPYSLRAETYGRFLIRLFDLWEADLQRGNRISIRTFDNWLSILAGYPAEACGMSGRCAIQFVVEGDGSVYPCDFYVLDPWKLGVIGEQELTDMARSDCAQSFLKDSFSVPDKCKRCTYYALCRNGCKRERAVLPDGTYGCHRFCRAYETFFDARLAQMRRLAHALLDAQTRAFR